MRTPEAARTIGISPRQLDHLARTGIIDLRDGHQTPGSGHQREWDGPLVDQLRVAVALNEVISDGNGGTSALPSLAASVTRAGTPPRQGWALYHRAAGSVGYAATIADLAEAIAHAPGILAARYNLDQL